MPYVSKEQAKEVRSNLKKEYPDFKISVRKENYTSLYVTILSGPIEMITNKHGERYESVNHFYINDHFKDHPDVRDVLLGIYKIVNKGNHTESFDGDYGNIPSFYVNIRIGDFDTPYIVKK